MSGESDDIQASGWDAIDAALHSIYGGLEPRHWGTIISWQLGGPDPIRGISAYRSDRDQVHWHYVTFGFSELYEKETDDPLVSGFGFELTFRLACQPDEEPPNWVLNFLQNLGRYVFETGNRFGAGDTMPLNGPIAAESTTKLRAISFVVDPELGSIDPPNGHVDFLQIVGLTEDELAAVQCWNGERFLKLVQENNARLITDLSRDSWLTDPAFAAQVEKRTRADGASAASLYCDHAGFEASVERCTLRLGVTVAKDLSRRLPGRIPFGRPFSVFTEQLEMRFAPGDHCSWTEFASGIEVRLPRTKTAEFVRLLQPNAGRYQTEALPGLTVVIEKSLIRNQQGEVIEEIG